MRRVIYIAIFFLLGQFLLAQQDSIAKAQLLYNNKNYKQALKILNNTVKNNSTGNLALVYQLQAYVLKDYAKTLFSDSSFNYRILALNAVQNCIALDSKLDVKGLAKYLSQTFNNDAAQSLAINDFKSATEQFYQYTMAANLYATQDEIKIRNIDFKNAYASALNNQYVENKSKKPEDFKNVELAYQAVLKEDPENISANYSLGVLYYNQAIEIVISANPDETDIAIIDEMQSKMQPLFTQSEPYLEKASLLAPNRTDVLKGLEIVYFNLNNLSKYNAVQEKLKKMGVK
jgi:hypothetical protein